MISPAVLRALAPRDVWLAYRTAKPLPIEEMPSGPTLRHIRQAANLSREVLAVVGGVGVDAITDVETGRTEFSFALNKSESGRRLVAALVALDEAKADAEEVSA